MTNKRQKGPRAGSDTVYAGLDDTIHCSAPGNPLPGDSAVQELERALQPLSAAPVMVVPDREQIRKIVADLRLEEERKIPPPEVFFRTVVKMFLEELLRKKQEGALPSWTIQICTEHSKLMPCLLIGNDALGVVVELNGALSDSVTRIAWKRLVALQCNDLCDETIWERLTFEIPGYPAEPIRKAEHALRMDLGMASQRGSHTIFTLHLINGQEVDGEIEKLNDFGCLLRSADTKTRGMDDLYFIPWTSVEFYDLNKVTAEELGLIKKPKK